jgi:autotransporter-associated beta strand protein
MKLFRALFLLVFSPMIGFSAVSSTWNDTNGNWSAPANWTAGVPQTTGDTAIFPVTTTLYTINLDISPSLGILSINDGYTFSSSVAGFINFNTTPASNVNITTVNNNATFNNNLGIYLSAATQFNISTNNLLYSTQIASNISGGPVSAGSLVNNGTGSCTMSGVISDGASGGHLSLTQNGSGTLTLTNANTFSGGTTINSGKLIIGNSSSLGTGSLIINGGTFDLNGNQPLFTSFSGSGGTITSSVANGTLRLNLGSSITYPGSIVNSASLTLLGGNLTLSGSNTYSGTTTINAGTLTGGASNAFGTSSLVMSGGILDLNGKSHTLASLSGASGSITSSQSGTNCNLTINGSATTSFSGTISNGSGIVSLIQNGTGIQTLSAANTYTGSTTILSGTFQAGVNNAFGTTSSLIMSGGTLDLNAKNQTFTSLSGSLGSITSTTLGGGSCTFTVNGSSSATFGGNITNGATQISFVKNGTGLQILSGTHSIHDATIVNGTLAIDNTFTCSNGINVNSNGILQGSGTLIVGAGANGVVVNGILAPGDSIETLDITGDLTFNAGSQLQNEISPTASDLINVTNTLTINPGSSLAIVAGAGFYDTINYLIATANPLVGTFSSVTFPSFVVNAPLFFQMNVLYSATQISLSLVRTPFSNFFQSGNVGAVASCLDRSVSTASNDWLSVLNSVISLTSLNDVQQALFQMQPSLFTSLAVVQESVTLSLRNALSEHLKNDFYSCYPHEGVGFWISPIASSMQQKHHKLEPGYSSNMIGVFLGLDDRSKESSIGIGFGYDYHHLHWFQNASYSDANSLYLALYGLVGTSRWCVQAGAIGGYNYYHTDRHLQFGSIDRHAKGKIPGAEASGYLEVFVDLLRHSQWKCCPFLNMDYIYLHEWGFSEKRANSLNLHVSSKNADLLATQGGVDLRYCWKSQHHAFNPYLQVSLIRESRFFGEHENANFSLGCPMQISGYYPSRTLGEVSFGLHWIAPQGGVTFSYEGIFGSNYKNNSVSISFNLYSPQYEPPQRSHRYRHTR